MTTQDNAETAARKRLRRDDAGAPTASPDNRVASKVELRIEPRGATLRVTLSNELVMANLFPVKEALYRAIDLYRPALVEIDLGAASYADSAAFGMLLGVRQALKELNAELRLLNVGEELRRTMELMALDGVFSVQRNGHSAG